MEKKLHEPVLDSLVQAEVDPKLRQQARQLAESCVGLTLPLVQRHGDLHPSNLLFQNGRLHAVVDWEKASVNSWPLFDWLQFLFEYHWEITRTRHPSNNRERNLKITVDTLFDVSSSKREHGHHWTELMLSHYGLPLATAPLWWLKYASLVEWSGDKRAFLTVVVPAVIRWAGWAV